MSFRSVTTPPFQLRCHRAAGSFAGRPGRLALLVVLLAPLAGCTRPAPAPRSRDEIFQERLRLPTLYISEKSGKRIIAEGGRVNFVDAETGEVCWVAWACHAPRCPGRGPDGKPFLCIEVDAGFFARPDGTVGYDPARGRLTPKPLGMCPRCSAVRKPESETPAQAAEYTRFVQLHQLPEVSQRIRALDAELARRLEWDRQRTLVGRPRTAHSTR